MFDIGPEKLLLLLALALVIFGPKKLPEMARSVGKGLREFRQASSEMREQISMNGHGADEGVPEATSPGEGPVPAAGTKADSAREQSPPGAAQENDLPGGAT